MLKYYEQIPLALLELRDQRLNFLPVLMAVCLAGYRPARFMVLCGVVAPPVFGDHGVIAGCSIATTMIR
eukprot:8439058-Pyramimonas_sp.AAC.1